MANIGAKSLLPPHDLTAFAPQRPAVLAPIRAAGWWRWSRFSLGEGRKPGREASIQGRWQELLERFSDHQCLLGVWQILSLLSKPVSARKVTEEPGDL